MRGGWSSWGGDTQCPAVSPPLPRVVVLRTLTGVELEEQFDGVVVEVAAVQDHLDERGQAALPRGCHRHRARHVQGAEHCQGGAWHQALAAPVGATLTPVSVVATNGTLKQKTFTHSKTLAGPWGPSSLPAAAYKLSRRRNAHPGLGALSLAPRAGDAQP